MRIPTRRFPGGGDIAPRRLIQSIRKLIADRRLGPCSANELQKSLERLGGGARKRCAAGSTLRNKARVQQLLQQLDGDRRRSEAMRAVELLMHDMRSRTLLATARGIPGAYYCKAKSAGDDKQSLRESSIRRLSPSC